MAELLDGYQPDLQDQLQHVDPPLHTRHRRIVSRWFTPQAVAAPGGRHPRHRHALIDRFAAGGRVEILDALAGPLPATVIADTIGIPASTGRCSSTGRRRSSATREAEVSRVTSRALPAHPAGCSSRSSRTAAADPDDMVSDLVAARTADGEGLDDQAVLGLLMLFLGGGQETTAKAITTGAPPARRAPELQQRLRATPDVIPAFVEEVLRFDPPVRGIFRIATRDTDIGASRFRRARSPADVGIGQPRRAPPSTTPDRFDPERFAGEHRPTSRS